ncbi:hypothetical protein DFP72DRAFT_306656 [Ephemerocybe angulata]|uniref:Uncharacterized protein n=1 Tax=Ephemerocybe angulata TaxID=980116 RepID=A0A8H6M7M8_9AGAR|nr:hypothetical protein DFP72DRAFT_306656 [Tulosesus angulatus]
MGDEPEYLEMIPETPMSWSISSSSYGETETSSSTSASPVSTRNKEEEQHYPACSDYYIYFDCDCDFRQACAYPDQLYASADRHSAQLGGLGDSQVATNRLLDELRSKESPPDYKQELADRLARIEDLVQTLTQIQGHPRAPPQVQQFFMAQPGASEPSDGSGGLGGLYYYRFLEDRPSKQHILAFHPRPCLCRCRC